MRPHIREFLEKIASNINCPEPIVEVGALLPPGQEEIANLRHLFPGKTYIGCDMQAGTGVDQVEDLHNLTFADGEVGTFILADTLEHVRDPFRAMAEVHRVLSANGMVVFTSVMHFPIHDYPNDYWRYTPEAFRELSSAFASSAIFAVGDPNFPHTVAGIASKSNRKSELEAIAKTLADIDVPAPLHFEGHAAITIFQLNKALLRANEFNVDTVKKYSTCGFDAPFHMPGWVLLNGQWIKGWVADDNAVEVEVLAGEATLYRGPLNQPRPDIASQLNNPAKDAHYGFQVQAQLAKSQDMIGHISMTAFNNQGQIISSCESAPGLVLNTVPVETSFNLHSLDHNEEATQPIVQKGYQANEKGRQLVEQIKAKGEPVTVDLGCGFRKTGNIGIDITSEGTAADLVCRLGFEPIPLEDSSVDSVYCRDFLEHIPKAIYDSARGRLIYPIIDLMNEIWRIMKPGGIFESFTPGYPHQEVHQDPTHVSVWSENSMGYFCGVYPIAKLYGVNCEFEMLEQKMEQFYLHARIKKPE